MLGLCDAHYRFLVIDVGAPGREGDAGVFGSSVFAQYLENQERGVFPNLNLPGPDQMPFSEAVLPYVFVGDEAFPLKINLMRPYAGRGKGTLSLIELIFNYR